MNDKKEWTVTGSAEISVTADQPDRKGLVMTFRKKQGSGTELMILE